MKTIKTMETLLLAMVLVFVLGACASKKQSEDANTSVEKNTTVPTVTLSSLKLTVDKTSLNKDENTTVKVIATYPDNTTKDVTDKVEWIADHADAVKITAHRLKALQDKPVQLQAKLSGKRSNEIGLTIYWEVNGHRLPPEPDPKVNNATLLGVDVNHNGVRDDVERWIYKTYKDKHPIHIDIAMQAARGYKLVLEHPERAKDIYFDATAYLDCESYYSTYAKYFNEPILIKAHSGVGEYFRNKIYFNTLERKASYNQYDNLLSGDSYSLPKIEDLKGLCDFNTGRYTRSRR